MQSKGFTVPGWEAVRTAFDSVLSNPLEGGQVVVYHAGRKVVDLYGGCMDRGNVQPVTPSTLSQIFSATKGAGALMVAMLVNEGRIDINEPMSTYWPEFGQAGKEKITVRQALSHRAGLFSTAEISLYDSMDFLRFMRHMEKMAPLSLAPGTTNDYHGVNIGILMGGLVYKLTGLTPNEFFQSRVAEPLGLDFYIGRPTTPHVAARLTQMRSKAPPADFVMPPEMMKAYGEMVAPGGRFNLAFKFHAESPSSIWINPKRYENMDADPTSAVCENASGMGFTNARSLARMYSACLWPVDGVRLLSDETLKIVSTPEAKGRDGVLSMAETTGWCPTGFAGPYSFAPGDNYWLGPAATGKFGTCFGSPGAGGALGVADPSLQVVAAYVPTYYDLGMGSPTTRAIMNAVGACAIAAEEA